MWTLLHLVVGEIVRPGGRIPRLAPSSSPPLSLSLSSSLHTPHTGLGISRSRLCPPLRSDLPREGSQEKHSAHNYTGEMFMIMTGWISSFFTSVICSVIISREMFLFLSSQRVTKLHNIRLQALIKSILASDQTDPDKRATSCNMESNSTDWLSTRGNFVSSHQKNSSKVHRDKTN